MNVVATVCSFILAFGFHSVIVAGEASPSDAELDALIGKLKSDDFEERRSAFTALLHGGDGALQKLRGIGHIGDAEQAARIRKLIEGLQLLPALPAYSDTLDFWTAIWNAQASEDPDVWTVARNGFEMQDLPSPAAPPSEMVSGILDIRYGADGATIRKKFRAAFDALLAFRAWSRESPLQNNGVRDMTLAEAHNKQLDGVAKAGNAAVPAILNGLATPLPNEMIFRFIHDEDDLRLIVAAEKMKLKEAAPIIIEKVALGYPHSVTIQQHGISAVYRILGNYADAPNFPFDMGFPKGVDVRKFSAWYLETMHASLEREGKSADPVLAGKAAAEREQIRSRLLPRMKDWLNIEPEADASRGALEKAMGLFGATPDK